MEKRLLDSEWTVLHALWGKSPQTLKEIIASVKKDQPDINWNYKTYHSYLRIMLEKELIGCEALNARDKLYFAKITREQALTHEGDTLFARISRGSVGHLVAMMAEKGQLTAQDKEELTKLVARLEKGEGERNG